MIVDVADGQMSFEDLVAWFEYYIRRMPPEAPPLAPMPDDE